jgi:hypothetical protein
MSKVRILFTRAFWLDSAERALKSFAQGALGAWGQDALGADLFTAEFHVIAGAGATMALLSLLTSVASARVDGISPASIVPPGA